MNNIEEIRRDFPILNQKVYGCPLVYLDNAATTQKPQFVLDKIMEYYKSINSNIHRGEHYLSEQASGAYEDARKTVRDFINARSVNEVIFTSGTTESINLLAQSFGSACLQEGDEIIITEMEHHSNIVPWQSLCLQKGAHLKVAPIDDRGVLLTNALQNLISSKTRLIAVSYVSNVLGVINPVKEIIQAAHQEDIPVFVDGAQAVQHFPIDVQELDCDFFAFSGHKMYAATGVGVLYGKEKWLETIPPYQTGGGMVDSVSFNKTTYAELPLKFEAGTANSGGVISLAAAAEYLQGIGRENIASYEREMLSYAIELLGKTENLIVYGNSSYQCGPVSFNLNGVHPYDAGLILDKQGIAVRTGHHCAEPLMRRLDIEGTIRASFAVYNTFEEIERLVEGIRKANNMLR